MINGIRTEYYYVDRDGEVFSHILQYLRSGLFPVFYDVKKGHDYVLYARLFKEADYYCMERLVAWIKGKNYEKAVQSKWTMALEGKATDFYGKSIATVQLRPVTSTLKVYVCPRGLHDGNLSRCGRQCRNGQGSEPIQYREEVVHETIAYRQEVIFDYDVMDAN